MSVSFLFWCFLVTGPAISQESITADKIKNCPKQSAIANKLLKEYTIDETYKDPKKAMCVVKAKKPKEFGDFIVVINTARSDPELLFKFGPTGDYHINWVRFQDLNVDGRNEILFHIWGEPLEDDNDLHVVYIDRSRIYKIDRLSGGRHTIERIGNPPIPVIVVSYHEDYEPLYEFKSYPRDRLFTFNGNRLIERSPTEFPDYLKKKIRSFEEDLRHDTEVKKKYDLSEDSYLERKNYMNKARKYYDELVEMQKEK